MAAAHLGGSTPRVEAFVQKQRAAWRCSTALLALVVVGVAMLVPGFTFITLAGPAFLAVGDCMPAGSATRTCLFTCTLLLPLNDMWRAAHAALLADTLTADTVIVRPA